jgi:hypothetical protein
VQQQQANDKEEEKTQAQDAGKHWLSVR